MDPQKLQLQHGSAHYSDIALSPQFLRAALKRGVETVKLIRVKQSWKLVPTQKKVTLNILEKEGEKKAKIEEEQKLARTTRSGKIVSPVKKSRSESSIVTKTKEIHQINVLRVANRNFFSLYFLYFL
jgi:hypothetical protein